ncbi:MAG: hypothetical protein ACREMY_09055, partial [bacterium]
MISFMAVVFARSVRTSPGRHYIHRMTVARVNVKGARRWLAGHPWIYRTDVIERPLMDAGAVLVHDNRGKP